MKNLQSYELNLDAKPAKKAKKNKDDNTPGDDLIALDGDRDAHVDYAPHQDDYLAKQDNLADMIDDEENDSSFNANKDGTEGMDDGDMPDRAERKKSSRKSGKHKREKGDRKERKKHKKGKKESRRLRKSRDIEGGDPLITETPAVDGADADAGAVEESKDG